MPTKKIAKKKIRAALRKQPLAMRQAAAALLPKSRRQVGKKIGEHRREILRLRKTIAVATDPVTKLQLQQEMRGHAKALAALLVAASKKRKRALGFETPGIEPVGLAQAKTRLSNATLNLGKVNAQIKTLSKSKRGNTAVQHRRKTVLQLLHAQRLRLAKRIALLKRGFDFERPVKLAPARVAIQRIRLGLPPVYTIPAPADTTVLIRLLAGALRRRVGETDQMYRRRLRAYTQRALIRLINKRTVEKLAGPTAIRIAVEETMTTDAPALEAEADAGGVVADATAETMDVVIDGVAEQLDVATEEIQPEIPMSDPTDAQIDALLAQAEEEEIDASQAPLEDVDQFEAELLSDDPSFLDEELLLDESGEEGETGISTATLAIGGVAALGLLWFLSGR